MRPSIKLVIYRRFFLSFLLFFLLPVLTVLVLGTAFVFPQYHKGFQDGAETACSRTAELADTIFSGYENALNEVRDDNAILQYRVNRTVPNQILVEKRLRSYFGSNPYISDIYYYVPKEKLLISGKSTANLSNPSYVKEDILSMLSYVDQNSGQQQITKEIGMPRYGSAGAMIFLFKHAADGSSVILLINQQAIWKTLLNSLAYEGSTIRFSSPFGDFSLQSGGAPEERLIKKDGMLPSSRILYTLFIPQRSVYGLYHTAILMFYGILLVVVLGGVVLCVSMSQYTYRPLKISSDYITSLYQLDLQSGQKHQEIEQLFSAFEKLIHQYDSLNLSLKIKEQEIEDFQKYRVKLVEQVEQSGAEIQNGQIDQAIRYIDEHCCELDFSIGAVCEKYHFTPNRFSMEFKKRKGEPPIQYVSSLRIEKMKQLLLTTNTPVNILIEQVGYNDLSSFSKKFAKAVGVSPKRYREEFRVDMPSPGGPLPSSAALPSPALEPRSK